MSVFDRIRQQMEARKGQRTAAVAAGGIGEGTKEWDALSTSEKTRRYVGEGQDAVNRSTQAAMDTAMPGFQNQLQGIAESAIRRGVNLGDTRNIQTQNEGTLASAFQRNLANVANQNAMSNYNTALDRLYGYRDFRTGQDNAKADRRAATWGAIGSLGGQFLASPLGATVGGKMGSWVSRMVGRKPLPALPAPGARTNNYLG